MTAAVTWRREDAGSMPSMKAELHDPTRLSDDSSLLANETLDEGIILLPKGTRVTVTGNSRTKQSLVGRAGTVKKAIGLGGWHWLVSTQQNFYCFLFGVISRTTLAIFLPFVL